MNAKQKNYFDVKKAIFSYILNKGNNFPKTDRIQN